MGFPRNIGALFRSNNENAPEFAPGTSPEALETAADAVAGYKAEALTLAQSYAKAEGREGEATLIDYFRAAQEVGRHHGDEMERDKIQWNPAVWADLSGQKLDGFIINKDDISPSAEDKAKTGPGSLADKLGIEVQKDIYNLDGNGKIEAQPINEFFAAVEKNFDCTGASFNNCTFNPVTTALHAPDATFNNVVFDGMREGEEFTLPGKKHDHITFKNAEGGTLHLASGAEVTELTLEGKYAAITVENGASISGLHAENANIVHFNVAEGGSISHAHFEGATIEMLSSVKGSKWNDIHFEGANLGHVEMNGATLTGVAFDKDTHLQGLDLRGAHLQNVTIDGQLATREMLEAKGVKLDATTHIDVDPSLKTQMQTDKMMQQIAEITAIAANWSQQMGMPVSQEPQQAEPVRRSQSGWSRTA